MYLFEVELHNILKHKHLHLSFDKGLNIIRGENEAGKSSLLEGIGYCWLGASALNRKIDDSVHWGAKLNAMSSRTVLIDTHVSYEIIRSPAGAELKSKREDEDKWTLRVTGQKEVTNKVIEILGLTSTNLVDKTLFAQQKQIEGILSLGPTAVMDFIEELAHFDQMDAFIENVKNTVETGSTKAQEQSLLELQQRVQELPELENVTTLEDKVSELKRDLTTLRVEQNAALETFNNLRAQRLTQAHKIAAKRKEMRLVKEATHKYTSLHQELNSAILIGEEAVKRFRVFAVEEDKRNLWSQYQKSKAYIFPEEHYVGTLTEYESFKLERATSEHKIDKLIALNKSEIVNKRKSIITDAICDKCGSTLKDLELVALTNERIEAEINSLITDQGTFKELLAAIQNDLQVIQRIENSLVTQSRFLQSFLSDRVKKVAGTVPERLEWEGELPVEMPSQDPAEVNLAILQMQAGERAAVQLERLEAPQPGALDNLKKDLATLRTNKIARPNSDNCNRMAEKIAFHEKTLQQCNEDLKILTQTNAETTGAKKELELAIESCSKAVVLRAKNNSLVKALETAKAQVTGLLWEQLMAAVSVYFSKFRGWDSKISKTPSGFNIDGYNSRPSGSTMDILGLALRIVLIKMFTNIDIFILDEPSAACSDKRAASMTAGLLTTGFSQTILVTHRNLDNFAGKVIFLD